MATNDLLNTGALLPSAPFTDPDTGQITPVWWRFLMALFARTGGATGLLTADGQLLAALAAVGADDAPDVPSVLALLQADGGEAAGMLAEALLVWAGMDTSEIRPMDDYVLTGLLMGGDADVSGSGSGTVTSLVAGANISLSPSTITTTGTISATGLLIASNNLSDVSSAGLSRQNINKGSVALTTSGASIATNAALGNVFTALLVSGTGPYTLANPSNLAAGATYIWVVTQPASGSTQTMTYGSVFKFALPYSNSSPPALTATLGAVDILCGVSDGTRVYVGLGNGYA